MVVCDPCYYLTSSVKLTELLSVGMMGENYVEVVFQPDVEMVSMKRLRGLTSQQLVSAV